MSRAPLDPRLLRHARSARTGIGILAIAGAGQAAATVTIAVALARIVTGGDGVALLAAAFVARAALTWTEQVVARRTAARATGELRRKALAATLRHGPAWAASHGTGKLAAVLTGGLDALRPWFAGYLPSLILGVALPPLVLAAMAVVDPASAVIALVTLPLIPVLGALIGWATQKRAEAAWQADTRLAGHFLDVVQGLATLRVFGRAERQTAVVADLTGKHRSATMRVLRVAFLSSTALDLVGTLSVGLIAVEAGIRVAGGTMPLGPALLVILLAPEAYRPLREMAARFHASADATAVIGDVDHVLIDEAGYVPLTAGAGSQPSLHASRLRVAYAGAAALDLAPVGVRAGEIVALRGPSGAGKTTALRVLAGLQDPTSGRVSLTGPGVLYLPQRPVLPHVRTVADVFPGLSEARVRAALATVGLDGELTPETALGEHGSGVSSGQRQRLALAALLRAAGSAPTVMLLDEPTAHLDVLAEVSVIGQLRAAAGRGCAILVVAHRPALLEAADRVVDVVPPDSAASQAATPALPAPASPAPAASVPATSVPTLSVPAASVPATSVPTLSVPAASVPATSAPAVSALASSASAVAPSAAPVSVPSTVDDRAAVARASAASGSGAARAVRVAGSAGASVVFGAAAPVAGIVLTGAAAWLLVRASSMPPVLTLSAAVVLVRGSAVARPLLRYLERLVSHDVAFARLGQWRSRLYAGLIPRVPGPRLRRRGDLLTRLSSDVDARTDGLLRGRLPALSAAVAVTAGVGVAVAVAPALALPLGAGVLISCVAAPVLAARQATRVEAATTDARAELRDAVVETVDGIEELALRGGEALTVPSRRTAKVEGLEARAARWSGAAAALSLLGWGVAVAGTALVLRDQAGLSAEWSAVLLLAVVALGEPVATLPDTAIALRRAGAAEVRLREIEAPAPLSGSLVGESADVVVSGLVAGWDPASSPALHDVDLHIPRGGSVAVLGASGGGKSTLAAVLAGLLDPRAGTVTRPGRTILVGDLADHVFASTLRENLRLAAPRADDAELLAALDRVGLTPWVTTLASGLDSWLGAGATTISGGQRRRLATARALLADPDLLILDEPTEGLDEAAADALMTDLLGAARGRTVLLLTHRTEGLALVDAIHEMRSGRLLPSGTRGRRTVTAA